MVDKTIKKCRKCEIAHPIENFHFRKDTGKHRSECKNCVSEYDKRYKARNKLRLRYKQKLWEENNPDKINKYKKEWKRKNKDKIKNQGKKYREENREKVKKQRKNWENNNPNYYSEYLRYRRANDVNFRLASTLRSRLSCSVKNNYKCGSAVSDMGCSIQELRLYLEERFLPGMTWDNYGDWHIDHIMPLSSFDLTDRGQFLKACHYTNLQPLWAADNLKKGARVNV